MPGPVVCRDPKPVLQQLSQADMETRICKGPSLNLVVQARSSHRLRLMFSYGAGS